MTLEPLLCLLEYIIGTQSACGMTCMYETVPTARPPLAASASAAMAMPRSSDLTIARVSKSGASVRLRNRL